MPDRHTAGPRRDLFSFPLPVDIAPFTVSVIWHPRMDGDLAHRWLRGCLRGAARLIESVFIAFGTVAILALNTLRLDANGADEGMLVVVGQALVAPNPPTGA